MHSPQAAAAARMGRSPKVPGNSSSSGNSGSGSGSGGVGSSRKSGLNNSTNSTRITPPKAGRLSAVNNGGSAGGRSPGAGVSRPVRKMIARPRSLFSQNKTKTNPRLLARSRDLAVYPAAPCILTCTC